ncbi:glycoside hydrolase superfamily [Xylariales sp. AK1849]|nr:glycoside hydrolase superfamily [Xylariales sp. AK1849]
MIVVPRNVSVAKRFFFPTQQYPPMAPALPIIDISASYIETAANVSSNSLSLTRRDPLRCDEGKCADGSCCGIDGICSYGPTYCGDGNCASNCKATGKENFGVCEIVPPPTCGKASSASGRTIGYYQAANIESRICNKVRPAQLEITGFTHLYYAFVEFDPSSFAIVNNNADLYKEFTVLQKEGLETWVAVGGYDFSDPGATHTAWSDMASNQSSRAAFIASLKLFIKNYDFQGVDIDWEYPAAPERGGKRSDTENLVSLVKEMRASLGSDFGISMALVPDYWYLRGFDAKAMEASVDWFGFMVYDLHGSWDSDADIREIGNDTAPLWFDGLDPAKINFGLAYYGRGYTLADPGCNNLLCPFSGPSKAAPCTNFAGVMSLREIEQKIADDGLQPRLLTESSMKVFLWDDQWIGYDDDETIQMKKKWADQYCFEGTMV